MGTSVALSNTAYLGALDLSSLAERIDAGTFTVAAVDFTNHRSGGFRENKPGIGSGTFAVDLFQDHDSGVLDDVIGSQLGSRYAITTAPNSSGTETAGDVCYLSRGSITNYNPLIGKVGEAHKAMVAVPYDTAFVRGYIGHPKTARTSTGTGTAVALAGPTSTQRLYATLHVFAYSGLTNVVVKVQSDDNSNFTSATDRITFTTVTGTTSEYASVAGSFSSETHHRATWTVTGTGSITFAVAFGVI